MAKLVAWYESFVTNASMLRCDGAVSRVPMIIMTGLSLCVVKEQQHSDFVDEIKLLSRPDAVGTDALPQGVRACMSVLTGANLSSSLDRRGRTVPTTGQREVPGLMSCKCTRQTGSMSHTGTLSARTIRPLPPAASLRASCGGSTPGYNTTPPQFTTWACFMPARGPSWASRLETIERRPICVPS